MLGRNDTFGMQFIQDVLDYYSQAIDIAQITKTVESFGNAMIEVQKQRQLIERTKKRKLG